MKKAAFFCAFLLSALIGYAEVPDDYKQKYASLSGTAGEVLFDALSAIAAEGYQAHSYNDLWAFFSTTDVTADSLIWDIYSNCTFIPGTNQCGNYSKVCDCYNREHSLPKSWFGGSTSNAPGNDLFHLYPTDGKVNGQRSNYPYGECAEGASLGGQALGRLGNSTLAGHEQAGVVFEPNGQYKGDLARSYFGMLVRYGRTFAFNQAAGGVVMFSNSGGSISAANHFGFTPYSVALLMGWDAADSVSEKEQARNDAIQRTQGNRNPFIDCPVLAQYLWGQKAGQAVALQDLVDCGCADAGSEPSGVEQVAFPSLTLSSTAEGCTFTCLPAGATIAVVSASGQLMQLLAASGPEQTIALPAGFYLLIVRAGAQQQAFKVVR